MPPQIISGDIGEHDPIALARALHEAGIERIDTAAVYGNGESERKLGASGLLEQFAVDTKVLLVPGGVGTLSEEAVERSLSNSLKFLNTDKVNVYYCHAPDHQTPIHEQAKGLDKQYRDGRFAELGVSNFPPAMVEEWMDVAEKYGLVKPSVFQGQYNLFCRGYEETLFPILKKHNITFNAYSPLAGGFLNGNFTSQGVQGGKRYAQKGPFMWWYDRPGMHQASEALAKIAAQYDITMKELSLRWLAHHSALGSQDGIIIGSSSLVQYGVNVQDIGRGPLDTDVVKQLDGLWDLCKDDGLNILKTFEKKG